MRNIGVLFSINKNKCYTSRVAGKCFLLNIYYCRVRKRLILKRYAV